jgi:sec-independent protein translocase protein TatC
MAFLLVPFQTAWALVLQTHPNIAPPDGVAPAGSIYGAMQPHIFMGGPVTGIMSIIIVTTVVGVFVTSPWVLYQLWSFIAVGLHEHERKFVRVYGPISFFLFLGGSVLFYWLLPYTLAAIMTITLTIQGDGGPLIDPSVQLADYLKFIALMTVIFGLMFETPLVVIFLARTGLVPVETLARKQKLIIFIMIVAGAVLAPTGDPVTCGVMAGILIILFEVGLLVAWIMGRRQRKRETAEAQPNPPRD